MSDDKDEKPQLSARASPPTDVANLNSLASLNLLHSQLMQLRASVNQFLYPLSKPDTHRSGTAVADSFAEQAQISYDILKTFSSNYGRHKAIFDLVNEKYEANPKGLMPFRTPTSDELAFIASLPPPAVDSTAQTAIKPPPAIEYFDDGLNDITRITEDWETFKSTHANITCEDFSDTTFQISFPKPVQFFVLTITLATLRSKPSSYTLAISSPKPVSSDLHAAIIKELAQHKKPKSFADFLVYPLMTIGLTAESRIIIPIHIHPVMPIM